MFTDCRERIVRQCDSNFSLDTVGLMETRLVLAFLVGKTPFYHDDFLNWFAVTSVVHFLTKEHSFRLPYSCYGFFFTRAFVFSHS